MSAIPSWCRVGAKVVCIDNVWPENTWNGFELLPELETPYTIRAVQQHVSGEWGILIAEIKNEPHPYIDGHREAFFHIKRFKPLISREDDITTHFADLLDVREPVGV